MLEDLHYANSQEIPIYKPQIILLIYSEKYNINQFIPDQENPYDLPTQKTVQIRIGCGEQGFGAGNVVKLV